MSTHTPIYDYDQITAGIRFLWNNRFDAAEQIFGSQEKTNHRYALHFSEVGSSLRVVHNTCEIEISSSYLHIRLPFCGLSSLQMLMTQPKP